MKTITILEITSKGNSVSISLNIDGNKEKISTTFSENVTQYITVDRIDSVIMGLILFAIKRGYDFKSDIPISESLYYNLTNQFIDTIAAPNELHHPRIIAPIVPDIGVTGNIVATGISCGVDSLYTIYTHANMVPANYKLNHLVFLNVGSHHSGKEQKNSQKLFLGRRDLCRNFSTEANLPLIEIGSDIYALFDKYDDGYSHVEEHTYMALFCMLLIQRGLRVYYYSSGLLYSDFNCKYNPDKTFDAALYDLLILQCASVGNTKFISAGGNVTRTEKLKSICNYTLAHKYLNVCVIEVNNCGKCFKCIRTMLELDAIGKLHLFKKAFDVNAYMSNRNYYLELLYIGSLQKNRFMVDLMPYFKKDLTFTLKLRAILKKIIQVLRNRLNCKNGKGAE